jgi:hypothetical protein
MAKVMLPPGAEELRDYAAGLTVRAVAVVDAVASVDADSSGEEALFLELTLAEPPPGADTWPLDDVLELYRLVNERALDLGLPLTWHVMVHSARGPEWELD